MKKNAIILLCLMAMVATIARAQSASRWGVTVGGNYNEIHFKQTDIFQSKPKGRITGSIQWPTIAR